MGCDLETVAARGEDNWRSLLGRHIGLARRLVAETGDEFDVSATRVWTVAEALRKGGTPLDVPVVLENVDNDGWVELRSGNFIVASGVLALSGQPSRFAVAFVWRGEIERLRSGSEHQPTSRQLPTVGAMSGPP